MPAYRLTGSFQGELSDSDAWVPRQLARKSGPADYLPEQTGEGAVLSVDCSQVIGSLTTYLCNLDSFYNLSAPEFLLYEMEVLIHNTHLLGPED